MKIRPAEFWERFESSSYILDRILRKLKEGDEIVETSQLLIQRILRDRVLAIEFLPQLIEFCQKIEEWVDVERLDPRSIVSLRTIFKTVKTAIERLRRRIAEQNYVDHDPLEFYQLHLSMIEKSYSAFMAKVASHASTSSTVQDTNHKRSREQDLDSSSTEEDVKPAVTIADEDGGNRTPSSDSSDDSESERSASSAESQQDELNFRNEVMPESSHSHPEEIIVHQEVPPITKVKVKIEEELEVPDEKVNDLDKQSILDSQVLDDKISFDLWVSHHVVKNVESFQFPTSVERIQFRVENVAQLTHPRFDSLATNDSEDQKALPMELVLIIDAPIENETDFTGIQDLLEFSINKTELMVQNMAQESSSIKLVLPIHPDSLKEGKNKLKMKNKKGGMNNLIRSGKLSIEVLTMMSEREIVEKAIHISSLRTVELVGDSQGQVSIFDPITETLIRIPVRGCECDHLECFDLQSFIQRNRFTSTWTCPFESCKRSCNPIELEFDQWIFDNIQQYHKENNSI